GRVLFEMALVRLTRLEDLVSLAQLAQAVSGAEKVAPDKRSSPAANAAAPAPSKKNLNDGEALPRVITPAPRPAAPPVPVALNAQSLPSVWEQVLAQLGQFLRNDLEKAGIPAISGPNTLVLRFPPGYNASRDRCQDPDKVARIEQLLLQFTGQKCNL